MNTRERAQKLRALAKKQAAKEMLNIRHSEWMGQISAEQRATQAVSIANKMTNDFIDAALKPLNGSSDVQKTIRCLSMHS